MVEIGCSDDILITPVVGPGEEAHIDSHEIFENESALSIQMLSLEERQSFALSMETLRLPRGPSCELKTTPMQLICEQR